MLAAGLTIAEIIADIGIGSLIHQTIHKVVQPTSLNLAHKFCLYLGEAFLIGMVCEKCDDSMEKEMDKLVQLYKDARGGELSGK